jgi:hypothetical protein
MGGRTTKKNLAVYDDDFLSWISEKSSQTGFYDEISFRHVLGVID